MGRISKIWITFIFIWTLSISASASESLLGDDGDDRQLKDYYQKKCREIDQFIIKNSYTVHCYHNYHHFNSRGHAWRYSYTEASRKGNVRIATYNLWHPGSTKSGFKDLKLIAKIINEWDVVSALELLPVIGRDADNNESVLKFLDEAPGMIKDLKDQLGSASPSEREELEKRIEKLKDDLKDAPELYRAPTYIKILEKLRELDPSWALILAPKGEAAEPHHVQELAGFYYRSSVVKPVVNEHCEEFKSDKDGTAFGCIPNLKKEFMGRQTGHIFSRRPFMASFKSADFDFTLVTSHVIYTSPDEEPKMREILETAFGVSNYEDLGTGVSKATYARFAEVKVTLEFIKNYKERYHEQDVIFLGDMNLQSTNQYWDVLLSGFPGQNVYMDQQTSLSQPRYDSSGDPTNGFASNYDHFIFSKERTSECTSDGGEVDVKRFEYYSGDVERYVSENYIIRKEEKFNDFGLNGSPDYEMTYDGEEKINRALEKYKKYLRSQKIIRHNEIVWDDYRYEDKLEFFKNRVFMEQLYNRTYYRVFMEVLSDHFPVYTSCRNTGSDDDRNAIITTEI